MKKLSFFLILFVFNVAFGQKTFVPEFEVGKVYSIVIANDVLIKNKKGVEREWCKSSKNVELKFLRKLPEYNLNSWTINNYVENSLCSNGAEEFLKGFAIDFKTSETGKYLGVSNLDKLRDDLVKRLSKSNIESFAKNSKDPKGVACYLEGIQKYPDFFLKKLEKDIITYCRYNGTWIDGVKKMVIKRKDFPVDKYDFPFNVTFAQDQMSNINRLVVTSELARDQAIEEDWLPIISINSVKYEPVRKKFLLNVEEVYSYDNDRQFFTGVDIKTTESSLNLQSVRYDTYSLKVL